MEVIGYGGEDDDGSNEDCGEKGKEDIDRSPTKHTETKERRDGGEKMKGRKREDRRRGEIDGKGGLKGGPGTLAENIIFQTNKGEQETRKATTTNHRRLIHSTADTHACGHTIVTLMVTLSPHLHAHPSPMYLNNRQ